MYDPTTNSDGLRYLHPVTFRPHEMARRHSQPSETLLWILRVIGMPAKSPASKVTLEELENETINKVLADHRHRPFPEEEPSMAISEDHVPPARCRCGVRIRLRGDVWRPTPWSTQD